MPKGTWLHGFFERADIENVHGAALQIAIAEGLVWRVVEMAQRLDLKALSDGSGERHVAAATDTPVQISLVSAADLSAAVRYSGTYCHSVSLSRVACKQ